MLGKTAAGLFWMFRYLERAEATARLLDAGFRIALTRAGSSRSEWESVLTTVGQIDAFKARHGEATSAKVIEFLLSDRDNPSSIIFMVKASRYNARAVRIAPAADERRPDFDTALDRIVNGADADIGLRTRSASPVGLPDRWPAFTGLVHRAGSRGAGLALVGASGRDARRAADWAGRAFEALTNGRPPPGLQAQAALTRLAGRAVIGSLASRPARLVTMARRTKGDSLVRALDGSGTFLDSLQLLWAGR